MSTIVIDLKPEILQVQYPQLYYVLTADHYYEDLPTWSCCDHTVVYFDFQQFQFHYFPVGTEIIYIDTDYPAFAAYIPEPATWLMLLIGLALLGGVYELEAMFRRSRTNR